VAAHLEPEVLLVDEVLAVGDARFQKRCMGKMGDIAKTGRTVLFISHNMAAIENLCERVLWLEGGLIARAGDPAEVITAYLSASQPVDGEEGIISATAARSGSGHVRLTRAYLLDSAGEPVRTVRSGMDVVVSLDYRTEGRKASDVDVGIAVHTLDGVRLFGLYRSFLGAPFETIPERGTFRCSLPRLPLSPGRYELHARVLAGGDEADWPRNRVLSIDVEAGDFYGSGSAGFGAHAPLMVVGRWDVVTS
jgi:lipopolysaccharide transport system ATP-binding protein